MDVLDPSLVLADDRIRAPRRRAEPAPLEQIPVWHGLEPDAGPDDPALAALLAGLNPEQRRAVVHARGPLLVVAGAGTGKTEVITRRVAWLIATRRARPSEILGLTFTEKAAAEMQVRVDQLVPYGFADTSLFTFHAFGDRLIRDYAFEAGLSPDVRVLSRAETVVLLREHLFELGLETYRPLGDPTRFLGALATLFARCRDEDIAPARYRAFAESLAADAAREAAALRGPGTDPDADEAVRALEELAGRQRELATAYERYLELLERSGSIDFGDQVWRALRLLRDHPAIRSAVQQRYRFVLVDEFQDTNPVQAALVRLIAERHRNVTLVGDDDQSIYRFRGAALGNILDVRSAYPGVRTVVLRRNYRSTAPILDAAHRLIRFNDPHRLEVQVGISKRLSAQRPGRDSAPVRHQAFATGAEEADWIAADIRARVAAGAHPRDHAVLVRANADADAILRSLGASGIPWHFSGTAGLYARPEVRVLLSVLRFVADPSSSVDLYAIAASEPYGLPAPDLAAGFATARRSHRSAWSVFEELDASPAGDVSAAGRPILRRLVGDLRRLVDLARRRPAGEVLYAFLRESGWLAMLAEAGTPEAEAALANAARFFDIVRARTGLLTDPRAAFLAPHLGTLIEAGDDPAEAEPDPDRDAVSVLTVHRAKGLEFPVVYVPGLVAGRFPTNARRDPLAIPDALLGANGDPAEAQLEEERRLFYVAMTRARDELILSHAADYGGTRQRRVSRFVLEALDMPSAVASSLVPVRPDSRARIAAHAPIATLPVAADSGPVVGPLALSHSSIDAYLTCPRRFQFGHVLRIPTAPHHALVVGSALHQVVQEFHRAETRGQVLDEAEIEASLERAWTNEGFVSREHEQARRAAASAALRRFRTDRIESAAPPPAWIERDFAFSLDGDRIRGRFDRVDIEPVGGPAPRPEALLAAASRTSGADVVEPTLELLGRERVTITDYKSSDVRDPAKARQRARDSLQLQIYAMAYEAMTGRLPDALQLHFLESGLVGQVPVEPERLEKARGRIAQAAAGIRARDYDPTPDAMTCSYCPFRDICPSSAAT